MRQNSLLSIVRISPKSPRVTDRIGVSNRVRNRDKLHLWLWRTLAKADRNVTKFGLVHFRTSDQSPSGRAPLGHLDGWGGVYPLPIPPCRFRCTNMFDVGLHSTTAERSYAQNTPKINPSYGLGGRVYGRTPLLYSNRSTGQYTASDRRRFYDRNTHRCRYPLPSLRCLRLAPLNKDISAQCAVPKRRV